MSELAMLFDEAYEAPINELPIRLTIIANSFKVAYDNVVESFYSYIESDTFKVGA